MPNNKKKTVFLAVGELVFIVVCACLLSASIVDTTYGIVKHDSQRQIGVIPKKATLLQSIIDHDIEADFEQTGKGSWYGGEFHRRKTASGERFDMNGFTAAHRSLPFGTIVRVTDLTTNKSVLVCINDRGPFIRSKVIDLSKKAAQTIGGSLKNLKLEAFLPDKSLSAYHGNQEDCSAPIVGFGFDQQLKSAVCSNNEPWTYTDNFNNALFIQKELSARFQDCEVLISTVQEPIKGGYYAVFVIPTTVRLEQSREIYGAM